MRDIRSDLEERANFFEEQIRAAYAHFEKMIQQLQSERDAKIVELKSGLATIHKLMQFENNHASKVVTLANPSASPLSLSAKIKAKASG